MVQVRSSVPGLSRGIQILDLLQSPMTVEELVRRTGIPKSSVLRILATLRAEGVVVRDSSARTHQAAITLTRNPALREPHLMPGDPEWQRSAGSWYMVFQRFAIPYLTTYASGGDADMGVMWRWIPGDAGFNRLRFSVHGGHAQVLLVEGDDPVPTEGDALRIHRDLLAGTYGKVLATVQGSDTNETDIPVAWDLAKSNGNGVKVVIIDSLSEPWGFISVSRMILQRS